GRSPAPDGWVRHREKRSRQSRVTSRNRPPTPKEFVLPNPRDFHAPKSSYTREDLLKSSQGGYFGPGNAQLPAPPMLMMDRIIEISVDGGEFGKGHVIGELDITPDLWFFDCHFPGDPVMPGCLGLDAMWQIIGYWLGWSGSARGCLLGSRAGGRQQASQGSVGLWIATPDMTSSTPIMSCPLGICARTIAPIRVAVAGSSASIRAKLARGRRDIAN